MVFLLLDSPVSSCLNEVSTSGLPKEGGYLIAETGNTLSELISLKLCKGSQKITWTSSESPLSRLLLSVYYKPFNLLSRIPIKMNTEEEDSGFTLDEEVFERALEDIEENPDLYDSFAG